MRVAARIVSLTSRLPGYGRLSATVLGASLLATAGCLDLKATPDACTISVAPASLTLPVNGSATIVGTAFDCKGNSIRNKRISYSSGNSAVATVTTEGGVIAIAVGSTTVSAVADGKTASVPVTITPEQAANVTINPNTLTLRRTNTRQLAATARNSQNVIITGRTFRWSSSNSSIVSVDQTGLLTALSAGQVVVTAETDQTVGSANIIVTEIPIGSCSLAPTNSKVTVSQSVQPSLTLRDTANNVIPSLGRTISWTSNNENVATVSGTGLVTTRRAGVATITASPVENAQIKCEAQVEAVDPRIAQVIISPRTGSLRLGLPRGFGVLLLDSANVQIPAGRIVTWSTNTPTIVQVSQAGLATGLSLGTARIIATSEGVADTITLSVTRIPVASVTVTPLQATVVEGQSVQLRATVTDSVGSEVTDRTIEWLTSDPSRATVNGTGLVTTIAPGNVNVVATAENRVGQSTIIIQQIPVDTIVAPATFNITRGSTLPFAIELRDAAGNILRNRTVDVRSDKPDIANVPSTTTTAQVPVTGLQVGTAIITLQALNANGQAQGKATRVTVNVTLPPVGGVAPPAASKR